MKASIVVGLKQKPKDKEILLINKQPMKLRFI